MESPGSCTSYIRCLNNRSQGISKTPEGNLEVCNTFRQEKHLLTEIATSSGWPIEGLSILLNGSLLSTEQENDKSITLQHNTVEINDIVETNDDLKIQTLHGIDGENDISTDRSVLSGRSYVTTEGLFLPNELLLQFQTDENTELIQSPQSNEDFNMNDQQSEDVITLNYMLKEDTSLVTAESTVGRNTVDFMIAEDVDCNDESIQLVSVNETAIELVDGVPNSQAVDVKRLEDLYEVVSAHRCKLCRLLCESEDDVVRHIHAEHSKRDKHEDRMKPLQSQEDIQKEAQRTVYLCTQCSVGYSTINGLTKHMVNKHHLINNLENAEAVKVPQQTAETASHSNSSLNVLVSLVKKQLIASKKVKCTFAGCEVRVANDDLRQKHEECHVTNQKKSFQCPKCSDNFYVWRNCRAHLWKSHKIDMGMLVCPVCLKFKEFSLVRMKTHMAIHDDQYPFLCETCAKGFKQFSQLKNHQLVHLDAKVDKIPDWASQKQCDVCQRYFANSKSLKNHIKCVHNKFKPFICNICGHKTSRKAQLDLHLRQHTGERPYKCTVCTFKTRDPNCLRRHVMRHDGVTKYTCPHCDYQSIQSTAFKNHLASKHPGKSGSYFCTVCTFRTVNETAFCAHKRGHCFSAQQDGGEKPNDSGNTVCDLSITVTTNSKQPNDEETQGFMSIENSEEAIDTGGITIAEEHNVNCDLKKIM